MKRRLSPPLAALLLALSLPAQVQSQGLPLGRLFHTPEERAQLNARRRSGVAGEQAAGAQAAVPTAPAVPPEPLQLNGVLQRSNGPSTVWVNQVPQEGADNKVLKDRAVSLQLPSGKRVVLKPGQSYDESDGTVRDATR